MGTKPGSIVVHVGDYQKLPWEAAVFMGFIANAGDAEPQPSMNHVQRKNKSRPNCDINELLLRPQLTEAEAARLMGIPTKTLGNIRREGKTLPRDIYVQAGKSHAVYYITTKLLEYINNQGTPVRQVRSRK